MSASVLPLFHFRVFVELFGGCLGNDSFQNFIDRYAVLPRLFFQKGFENLRDIAANKNLIASVWFLVNHFYKNPARAISLFVAG